MRLRDYRDGLLRDWVEGSRQRAWLWVHTAVRDLWSELPPDLGARERILAWLGLQAGVATACGGVLLVEPLTEALRELLPLGSPLADFLEPAPLRVWAETATYLPQLSPPQAFADLDPALANSLRERCQEAFKELPAGLWRGVALAAASGRRTPSNVVVLVPPGPFDERCPADLLAATPPGANVLDAAAERLTWAETVDAVRELAPTLVLHPPGAVVAPHLPEFTCAPLVGPGPDEPFPDPTAWPLACYRELVVPSAGRPPARLAADLGEVLAAVPEALVRVGQLDEEQAAALLAGGWGPRGRGWSMTVEQPVLPSCLADLRQVGLRDVVVLTAPGAGVPAALLSVIGEGLRQLRLPWRLEVELQGLGQPELAALVQEVTVAAPNEVIWCGTPTPSAAAWWEQLRAAADDS